MHLHMLFFFCTFAAEMKKWLWIILIGLALAACNRPSRVEQYRAEKHAQDSIRLEEQVRSMAFYQSQLDSLMPIADSLMNDFRYERNEKYQDHGFYVVKDGKMKIKGRRILVRDDGYEILVYRDGKRIEDENERRKDEGAFAVAEHLQIVIRDIHELEHRIRKTSFEIQKYQKRLTP